MKINKKIVDLRKARGMTQKELASKLGITVQAVSRWETEKCCPDIQLLPDIAQILGVTIDELFGY